MNNIENIDGRYINAEEQKKMKWRECELNVLAKFLPEWISSDGKFVAETSWLAITEESDVPKSERDKELTHPYGPLKIVATAMTKSEKYKMPKLEIHLTACPSYLGSEDWVKQAVVEKPIYIYENILWNKVQHLKKWINEIKLNDPMHKLVSNIYLHSPSPADLDYKDNFPGLFGIFGKPDGAISAVKHWNQMQEIANYCGITMSADVGYILTEIEKNGVNLLEIMNGLGKEDVAKFVSSKYIEDAYTKWGADPRMVLAMFYVGSIIGYGNRVESFSLENDKPLKLFVNCEEGWSPETFAGKKVGVDFRHLLENKGFHLGLLIGEVRTPWSGKA